jgi:hypothetical protein
MRNRLVTLAAASALAIALGASPALAGSSSESHADHWVVVDAHSTDIAGLGPIICGDNTYYVESGAVDFVEQVKGGLTVAGIAIDAGRGIETFTLNDVHVVRDGKSYRVVGSQRINATWPAGADVAGNPGGPFSSFTFVLTVRIAGTGDGHSIVARQLPDGTFSWVESGSCNDLTLYGS